MLALAGKLYVAAPAPRFTEVQGVPVNLKMNL